MFLENLKLAFNSMFTNKMRTFLSLLGIVIGVGSVVTIMNLGESVKRSITDSMNIGGVDEITVIPMGSNSVFSEEFAYTFQDNVYGIESVSAYVSTSATLRNGQETKSSQVYGVTSSYIDDSALLYGETFSKANNLMREQVVILGYDLAEDLFPGGGAVGSYVSIYRSQAKQYRVIGVLEDTSGSVGSNTNSNAYIPFNTFDERLKKVTAVSQYTIKVKEGFSATDVSSEVKSYLSSVASSNDYYVSSAQELVDMTESVTGYLTTFLAAIAAISLLVGGIGIMNIMLVTVVERTREIGIRKALGATPKTIRSQFMVEATVLSIFGGIIGIVFGVVVSYVISSAAGWNLYFSLWAILISIGFSSAVGIFFGWYPAAKAAALDPIEALAYE
ncbi:MAG: ABC transporter permease [Candidatus Ornithospirochaeta sp.]|nr:ABC transporter permease [Sphaerochaetaceae bacterium]MDY5523955.1 ABC transporter permease [Candidatus Ornithospirochaeta sp.]